MKLSPGFSIIDGDGNIVPRPELDTLEGRPSALGMSEGALRQVRRLGAIGVYFDPHSDRLVIRFDPSSLCLVPANTACSLIVSNPADTYVIDQLDRDFGREEFHDSCEAASRFLELSELGGAAQPERITGDAKPPESLFAESEANSKPLRALFEYWREVGGYFRDGTIPLLAGLGLLGRTVLVEPSEASGQVVFTYIGSGFTFYGETWPETAVGQPVIEQPDMRYGEWFAKALHVAMASGLPQYELVNALIRRSRDPALHQRYKCLRMLWRDKHQNPIVTSTGVDDRLDGQAAVS